MMVRAAVFAELPRVVPGYVPARPVVPDVAPRKSRRSVNERRKTRPSLPFVDQVMELSQDA